MVGKAVVPVLAQHNMVQHGDAEQLAAFLEALSQSPVFLTGNRIAAGVVVGQDDGARVHQDEWLEDFARVDDAHGDRSDAHGVDTDDSMLGVEAHDHEMLAIESLEERYKQPVCALGIPELDGRRVRQTFLHQHHPITGNRIGMLGWLWPGGWGFPRRTRRQVGLRSLGSSRCHSHVWGKILCKPEERDAIVDEEHGAACKVGSINAAERVGW